MITVEEEELNSGKLRGAFLKTSKNVLLQYR